MRLVTILLVSSLLLVSHAPTGDSRKPKRPRRKRTGGSACDLNGGSWTFTGRNPYPKTTSAFGFDCSYRKNWTFLEYSFSAPGCNIQKFDPVDFLSVMKNKRMMFVGDSIASNTYSAFAWSMPPGLVQFGPTTFAESSFRAPQLNASVTRAWSTFFVTAKYGESQCHLDVLDPAWTSKLNQSEYVAFNGWHHFFHKGVNFYKNGQKLSGYTAAQAIEDAAVAMRDFILRSGFKGTAYIFTYSPGHSWVQKSASSRRASMCTKSFEPLSAEQEALNHLSETHNVTTATLIKVFGNAGPTFRIVDIYKLSNFRADAHGGSGLGDNPVIKDCSHWCIPGLPNTWVDILYSMITGFI